MKIISFSITLIFLLCEVLSKTSYYVILNHPASYYQCMRSTVTDEVYMTLATTPTGLNQQNLQNIIYAYNSGLKVQVAINLCRFKSIEEQMDLIKQNIDLNIIQRLWVYPDQSNTSCSFAKYPVDSNCEYFQDALTKIKTKYNKSAEVSVSRANWEKAFGDINACPKPATSSLLWWVPFNEQTNPRPDFDSYRQIGGWKAPYMKSYATTTLCGSMVLQNYYE